LSKQSSKENVLRKLFVLGALIIVSILLIGFPWTILYPLQILSNEAIGRKASFTSTFIALFISIVINIFIIIIGRKPVENSRSPIIKLTSTVIGFIFIIIAFYLIFVWVVHAWVGRN